MLMRADLQNFAPRPHAGEKAANWDTYVAALENHAGELCAEFGIDTALELQHFMAQIAHESGGFTVLWEDMRYSAPRIMEIFGVGKHSAKVTAAESRDLAGKPKDLAERVYGLGNPKKARELGNSAPGDGYRYRGFGPMQITGRADHERYLTQRCVAPLPSGTQRAAMSWLRETTSSPSPSGSMGGTTDFRIASIIWPRQSGSGRYSPAPTLRS